MNKPWLNQYPDGVAADPGFISAPLGTILQATAEKHPDYIAATLMDIDLTYAQVNAKANGLAHGLRAAGVGQGDRVALILPNSPTYVIAFFAVMKMGAVAVNINVMLRGEELSGSLRMSSSRMVITLDLFLDGVIKAAAAAGVEKVLYHSAMGAEEGLEPVEDGPEILVVNEVIEAQPSAEPDIVVSPQQTAVVQFTSGTSGRSKAVELTHDGILANITQMVEWIKHSSDPGNAAVLCCIPFFHVFGLAAGMILAVRSGYRMILVPMFNALDGLAVFDMIKSYKPLSIPLVPPLWAALTQSFKSSPFNLDEFVPISGGAALPAVVADEFYELTGTRIIEAYGLSEASSAALMAPWPRGAPSGSVGLPLPGMDAKIIDLESGLALPPGKEGELALKGPQLMKGYLNDPELTAQTIKDGWLHTGDVARMDDDGFFYLVDRKDDLIISSGFNVYPRDIERILVKHPDVKDAAVVGSPAGIRGEDIIAFVVSENDQASVEEIMTFCRRELADFKLPRTIKLVPEIPRNPAGKAIRRALKG